MAVRDLIPLLSCKVKKWFARSSWFSLIEHYIYREQLQFCESISNRNMRLSMRETKQQLHIAVVKMREEVQLLIAVREYKVGSYVGSLISIC